MKRQNKKGFTIIELVIVISVIAILSAVLIPTFTSVTNKAKDSAALQEARNTYVEYAANELDALNNSYVIVAENGRAIIVKNGQIEEAPVYASLDAAKTAVATVVASTATVAGTPVTGTTNIYLITVA